VDLRPRPRLRREGGPGARSLPATLPRPPSAPGRVRALADEKSQLQALGRKHAALPPAPGRPARFEFDYFRHGTLAYLAAWDVHRANLFHRVEAKTGKEPFDRLVDEVMTAEPYASARTVFWIVDNGSSHAGQASIDRLQGSYDNLRLIHLPIHASWLNQIELYFSIVQRKALTPNDFDSLDALTERLLRFGDHYRQIAKPFDWTFTRDDLVQLLARIDAHQQRAWGSETQLASVLEWVRNSPVHSPGEPGRPISRERFCGPKQTGEY
jgi:DDE superfamily endonuclease